MRLFLSGGGSGEEAVELNKKFVYNLDMSKPLLYIPIARGTEKRPYSSCLEWLETELKSFNISNIVMWTQKELKDAKLEDFDKFGGIYIGGGNTFKLLKELRELGTLETLITLAKNDIPIFGGSAGAIICGETIIPAMNADPNDVKLTDFSALNLVFGYNIDAHYTTESDKVIDTYMKEYSLNKLIALPENCGLFVSDKIEVVGQSSAYLFDSNGKRELTVGTILE